MARELLTAIKKLISNPATGDEFKALIALSNEYKDKEYGKIIKKNESVFLATLSFESQQRAQIVVEESEHDDLREAARKARNYQISVHIEDVESLNVTSVKEKVRGELGSDFGLHITDGDLVEITSFFSERRKINEQQAKGETKTTPTTKKTLALSRTRSSPDLKGSLGAGRHRKKESVSPPLGDDKTEVKKTIFTTIDVMQDQDLFYLYSISTTYLTDKNFLTLLNKNADSVTTAESVNKRAVRKAATARFDKLLIDRIKKVDDLEKLDDMLKKNKYVTEIEDKVSGNKATISKKLNDVSNSEFLKAINERRNDLVRPLVESEIKGIAESKNHSALAAYLVTHKDEIINHFQMTTLDSSAMKRSFYMLRDSVTVPSIVSAAKQLGLKKADDAKDDEDAISNIAKENLKAPYVVLHTTPTKVLESKHIEKLSTYFNNPSSYERFKTYLKQLDIRSAAKEVDPNKAELSAIAENLNVLRKDLAEYHAFVSDYPKQGIATHRQYYKEIPDHIKLIGKIQNQIQIKLEDKNDDKEITYDTGEGMSLVATPHMDLDEAMKAIQQKVGHIKSDDEKEIKPKQYTTLTTETPEPKKDAELKDKYLEIPIKAYTEGGKPIKAYSLLYGKEDGTDANKFKPTQFLFISDDEKKELAAEKRIGLWNSIPGKAAMTLAAACIENHIKASYQGAKLVISDPDVIGKDYLEALMVYSKYAKVECIVEGSSKKISAGQEATFSNYWEREHPAKGKEAQQKIQNQTKKATAPITEARRKFGRGSSGARD